MKKKIESYVYTMEAAKKRLSRGYKKVFVFQPYTGRLLTVSKSNIEKVKKEFSRFINS